LKAVHARATSTLTLPKPRSRKRRIPRCFAGHLFTAYQFLEQGFGRGLKIFTAAMFLATLALAEGVPGFASTGCFRLLRPLRPRAVACLERDLDELLNFFAVPPARWRKVPSLKAVSEKFAVARDPCPVSPTRPAATVSSSVSSVTMSGCRQP
jgi:hypothetical protein